jgi:hypothetical protein
MADGPIAEELYADFEFSQLDSPDFKEDSVREELILPLLKSLGYGGSLPGKIQRAKKLTHPVVQVGSKQRKITSFPDYLLLVDSRPRFILDAKAPNEKIDSGANVEQAFFYAIHPDVRCNLYALCNGRELSVFHVGETKPVLIVPLTQAWHRFREIAYWLAAVPVASEPIPRPPRFPPPSTQVDYMARHPPIELTTIDRQTATRHFGVHGYFTKQPWNVVQSYIQTLTEPGDLVLDPFGGTGVTLIESLILDRRGIYVDLNPLAVFIVTTLLEPVDYARLERDFTAVCKAFDKNRPRDPKAIKSALRKYKYPRGVALPRNADVPMIEELFFPKQLAELALLKHLIFRLSKGAGQRTLMLMFSGLLNKINRTFHASKGRSQGRGDSGMFKYYRYRIAPEPSDLDVLKYFELRYRRVVVAKREIEPRIKSDILESAIIRKGTATDLSWIATESVDYIFTDPPYGSKIPYLDLSTMWNAWLDLPVSEADFEAEAIEGGERSKSRAQYTAAIAQAMREMARTLKFDRWMSFVFAHQTPAYWYMIVETAEAAGFEYAGAVRQKSAKTSFKKRQNPFTVLSGELIINFRKVKTPGSIARAALGAPVSDMVINNIEAVIARNQGATLEEINDELVIRGLEMGFLDLLAKEYTDLTPLLRDLFDYDPASQRYHIRPNTKFKSRIPLELRVRYFVVSFLRRCQASGSYPTVDEVVLHVMPLLKNGITPEKETILKVLNQVAEHKGSDRWRLQNNPQFALFESI